MLSNVWLHLIGKQLLMKKFLCRRTETHNSQQKGRKEGSVISFMEAFTQNSKLENLFFYTLTPRNLLSPYFLYLKFTNGRVLKKKLEIYTVIPFFRGEYTCAFTGKQKTSQRHTFNCTHKALFEGHYERF